MEPAQALQELDLVVARVSAVAAHPGARGRSALLTLELGGRGTREAPLPIALEEAEALVEQVVCALGERQRWCSPSIRTTRARPAPSRPRGEAEGQWRRYHSTGAKKEKKKKKGKK